MVAYDYASAERRITCGWGDAPGACLNIDLFGLAGKKVANRQRSQRYYFRYFKTMGSSHFMMGRADSSSLECCLMIVQPRLLFECDE
jgi:hypothetical protein